MHKYFSAESCAVGLNSVVHELDVRTSPAVPAIEPSLPSTKGGRRPDYPREGFGVHRV